jgi:hypothetical protein
MQPEADLIHVIPKAAALAARGISIPGGKENNRARRRPCDFIPCRDVIFLMYHDSE